MDQQTFWTAVGSAVAFATLAIGLIVHIMRYAYSKGVADQRLTTLEAQIREGASANAAIATLNIAVAGLSATVAALKDAMAHLDESIRERLESLDKRLNDGRRARAGE